MGYYGVGCELYNCYGTIFNASSACSNGTCIAPDMCSCQTNFYGNRCEAFNCFGQLYNSTSVCSGRGTCISPNQCTCNEGYIGVQCDISICFGYLSNDTTRVCGGHGICSSADNCTCDADYTWILSSNACVLNMSSSTTPVFASINGPSIQYTTTTGSLLLVGNAAYLNGTTVVPVQYIWNQIEGSTVITTQIGSHLFIAAGTLYLSSIGSFNSYAFQLTCVTTFGNVSASVQVVVIPRKLIAIIDGGSYRTVSSSQTLILNATGSYDPDSVPINSTYKWTCSMSANSNLPCIYNSSSTLSDQNWSQSVISIPAYFLIAGSKYYFTLQYSKGNRSSTSTVLVDVVAGDVPIVSITNFNPLIVNQDSKVVVRASAYIPSTSPISYDSNRPNTDLMSYEWSILFTDGNDATMNNDALALSIARSTNQTILIISPNILLAGTSYIIQITVSTIMGSSASSQVDFTVNTPPSVGQLIASPLIGNALSTQFTFTCKNWSTLSPPLTYV